MRMRVRVAHATDGTQTLRTSNNDFVPLTTSVGDEQVIPIFGSVPQTVEAVTLAYYSRARASFLSQLCS